MAHKYVEEFLYRGRCPTCEPGKQPAFHVVIGQFSTGPDDKPQLLKTAPLSPAQAAEAGFPIDQIMGEIGAAALKERDAALAELNAAKDEIKKQEAEKSAALAEVQRLKELFERVRNSNEAQARAIGVAGEPRRRVRQAGVDRRRDEPTKEMSDLMALRLDGVASAEQVQRHDKLLASASPDQA